MFPGIQFQGGNQPMRILLVDDAVGIRELVTTVLKQG